MFGRSKTIRHQQRLLHRSPFHADIFRSFSWSVNICGRKKWLFFPPGQEEALRDCYGGLPYDVTTPALLDNHLHPKHQPCSPPLEVTQEAGEMVFVPSGWHHQVHNLVGWALPLPHRPGRQGDKPWGTTGPALTPFQLCPSACSSTLPILPTEGGLSHPSNAAVDKSSL